MQLGGAGFSLPIRAQLGHTPLTQHDARYGVCMATQPFKDAERKQLSMLAAVEKKTLIWLAKRMPGWVNSDHLKLVAFVAMFVAELFIFVTRRTPPRFLSVIPAIVVHPYTASPAGTPSPPPQTPITAFIVLCDTLSDA